MQSINVNDKVTKELKLPTKHKFKTMLTARRYLEEKTLLQRKVKI